MKMTTIILLITMMAYSTVSCMEAAGADFVSTSDSTDMTLREMIDNVKEFFYGPQKNSSDLSRIKISDYRGLIGFNKCEIYYKPHAIDHVQVMGNGCGFSAYSSDTNGQFFDVSTLTGSYLLMKRGNEMRLVEKNTGKVVSRKERKN
jgi:hypothetical protein